LEEPIFSPADDFQPHPGNICRRLLVVDDNPDVASMFKTLLTLMGHSAESALDGESAIRLAMAHIAVTGHSGPDVILRAKHSGFDGHMSKPVDAAMLENS
jgi:CheY-like chemotaxis protein